MEGFRICVFASGSGTNAEKIIQYFQIKKTAAVVLVITNKPDAKVIERARLLQVPCAIFSKSDLMDTQEVDDVLRLHRITHIVLAGFLLQIPVRLIRLFPGRIINIHPSLLPKFGGKGMYGLKVHEAVKAAGETETGITIHEVNEHYDEGKIIFQANCPVLPTDAPEQIANNVQQLEHTHFAREVEKWVMSNPVGTD
ncbi:MAG: phosphoribosylglycinamide formyltransferase [Bacteroidota bacterium]|jgi:phosphoribosylglycinamide formyltransferase-1|nr:phosphoribosylglycinamide formyltransferase [Flammeovirgaceae bacterium]MCZ8068766.1 phosphoribosylglycinamide formyltransferase [Cytophagales bacterium]